MPEHVTSENEKEPPQLCTVVPHWYDVNPFHSTVSQYRVRLNDEKMCVLSILVKKGVHNFWTVTDLLNQTFGDEMFKPTWRERFMTSKCCIEVAVDTSLSLIIFLLIGPYDLEKFKFEFKESFQDEWPNLEHEYVVLLFFLFSVSHLILIISPTAEFDTSYLKKLRSVNWLREQISPELCSILSSVASKHSSGRSNGRLACPRLLFCVFRPPTFMRPDGTVEARRSTYRRMGDCLENMIREILHSTKLLKSPLCDSVCSLPEGEQFVYIVPVEEQPKNETIAMVAQMFPHENEDPTFCCSQSSDGFHRTTLGTFMYNHINAVLKMEESDAYGTAFDFVFEKFNLQTTIDIVAAFYKFLFQPTEELSAIVVFKNRLDISTALFEKLCNDALEAALNLYKNDLPEIYTSTLHQAKLNQAVQLIKYEGRGKLVDETVQKFLSLAEETWKNRRQCEELSLCQNPCLLPLHLSPGQDGDHSLPVMAHDSQVYLVGTCGGGHCQTARPDPFDLFTANYAFYVENPDFACCNAVSPPLESTSACNFESDKESPASGTHSAERPSSRASNLSASDVAEMSLRDSEQRAIAKSKVEALESVLSTLHLSSSLENSDNEEFDSMANFERKVVRSKVFDASRYAPDGMYEGVPSNLTPDGLEPTFPSWSLNYVGLSSKYTHSRGLRDQPNFTHGSQFLLPWDVTLNVDVERWNEWHTKADMLHNRLFGKRLCSLKGSGWSTVKVKVFVGYEYECPRGHRFMMRSPECILKHTLLGGPKNSADSVVMADMPLWYPCSCRNSAPYYLGLLSKIHVVTPKAPVHVLVTPQVKPDPREDLVFKIPTQTLTASTYWIVRLPFVYHSPGGAYYWKGDGDQADGLVLRNMITVVADCPPKVFERTLTRLEII